MYLKYLFHFIRFKLPEMIDRAVLALQSSLLAMLLVIPLQSQASRKLETFGLLLKRDFNLPVQHTEWSRQGLIAHIKINTGPPPWQRCFPRHQDPSCTCSQVVGVLNQRPSVPSCFEWQKGPGQFSVYILASLGELYCTDRTICK